MTFPGFSTKAFQLRGFCRGTRNHKPFLIITIVKRMRHLIVSISFPQEHVNLVGRDNENGPVLVSVKAETVAGQEHWRVLLRLRAGSTHDTPTKMVKVKAMVYLSAIIILPNQH